MYLDVFYKDIHIQKKRVSIPVTVWQKNVLDCGTWERITSVYFNKPKSEGVLVKVRIFSCFLHTDTLLGSGTLGSLSWLKTVRATYKVWDSLTSHSTALAYSDYSKTYTSFDVILQIDHQSSSLQGECKM